MVANKVKRNRSARHSNKGSGGVQLEIDAYGKLRKVGGGTAEEEEAKRKREAAKRGHVGYYRKVRNPTRGQIYQAMFAPVFKISRPRSNK